jgi:hypothetical protein
MLGQLASTPPTSTEQLRALFAGAAVPIPELVQDVYIRYTAITIARRAAGTHSPAAHLAALRQFATCWCVWAPIRPPALLPSCSMSVELVQLSVQRYVSCVRCIASALSSCAAAAVKPCYLVPSAVVSAQQSPTSLMLTGAHNSTDMHIFLLCMLPF